MRIPLKVQIVAPLMVVVMATVAALAAFQAVSAARRSQTRIEQQLADVARTLRESNFPLTQPVLEQMKGLSGADFVLESPLGTAFSTLELSESESNLPRAGSQIVGGKIALRDLIRFQGRDYFHVPLLLAGRRGVGEQPLLHVLYSQDDYRRARWEAVAPSAALGSVAVLATVLCGVGIARNVCRSVARIGAHVERIAAGDFRPVPSSGRDDELNDLASNVNLMAGRLVQYEEQVRRTEQLRTLGQLGAGLAHEIRNAITGSRMALQIHAEECPLGPECESLEVASRQLRLIETYVQRFLRLSKPPEQVVHQQVDLAELVEEVTPLVEPHARHLGVTIQCDCPTAEVTVSGDPESLGQVLLNLLFNAIEAVAVPGEESCGKVVTVRVTREGNQALLSVEDHGAGPSRALGEKLFDPFVSDKADGVGLGLSVSREIVQEHGGKIAWRREVGTTSFVVSLPVEQEEPYLAQSFSH
jgi:signal transduction histidine kinase